MKNDDDNDTNEEANNLFVFLCWLSVTLTLLAFAILAVWTSYRLPSATKDVETFITAKKSMTWLRVLWSLYSSSIGCWVLFLPASYVQFGGYLSIISYAISTGIPLYLIAFWGCQMLSRVQKNINSISDFALKRYGPIVQYYVISLTLLNMCIALISEYTAIGDLFEYYIGSSRAGIIVLVATLTTIYTAAGGLMVSILTDQYQSIVSILLIVISSFYLLFKYSLVSNESVHLQKPLPENLAANYAGWSSFISLSISFTCAAVFSEAFWQRVWSAENNTALLKGAIAASIVSTVVIAIFAFIGFFGTWANLPTLDQENDNLAFFVPFTNQWIKIVLVILAAIMSESAVDSLQNAIVSTISSNFLMKRPLSWTRISVLLVNIPLVVIALQGWKLLDLYFFSNLLSTTSTLPLLAGIWLEKLSSVTVLLACFSSFLSIIGLGILVNNFNLKEGLQWVFISNENNYDYRIFVVALLGSGFGLLIFYFLIDKHRNMDRETKQWKSGKTKLYTDEKLGHTVDERNSEIDELNGVDWIDDSELLINQSPSSSYVAGDVRTGSP